MKKLIKELEKLSRVSPSLTEWGEGYIPGVMDALQIVKAHNPLIDVCELPTDGNRVNLSIEVIVKNKRNEITAGHYNYNHSKWECDFEIFIPTHWTFLPDVP